MGTLTEEEKLALGSSDLKFESRPCMCQEIQEKGSAPIPAGLGIFQDTQDPQAVCILHDV